MKILIIAYHFSPEQRMGSVRPSKLTKYFQELGVETKVITLKKHEGYDKIDPVLNKDKEKYGEVVEIELGFFGKLALKSLNKIQKSVNPSSSAAPKSVKKIEKKPSIITKVKKILKIGQKLAVIKDKSWGFNAKKYIKKNYSPHQFDYVISFYGPIENISVGRYAFNKSIADKIVVDFRDTLFTNAYSKKQQEKRISILENVVDDAAFITTVSHEGLNDGYDLLKDQLKKKAYEKTHVLYNGYDVDDFDNLYRTENININQNIINLSYVGNLYKNRRDFSIVFKAIDELIKEKKLTESEIKIHYAGSSYDTLAYQASKFHLTNIIINYGHVSRDDSINLQSSGDAILVATWNEDKIDGKGILPGKLYEAIMLKKKIMVVINGNLKNSEIKQLVHDYKLGYAIETVDKDALEKTKKMIMDIKKRKIKNLNTNDEISNYDYFNYKNISKRYYQLLDDLNNS